MLHDKHQVSCRNERRSFWAVVHQTGLSRQTAALCYNRTGNKMWLIFAADQQSSRHAAAAGEEEFLLHVHDIQTAL